MRLIMTQRLDPNGTNLGGLYLNIDHISAIYLGEGRRCNVLMQDGTVYISAHSIGEILDMLIEHGQRSLADQIRTQCSVYDLRTAYHRISDLLAKLPE